MHAYPCNAPGETAISVAGWHYGRAPIRTVLVHGWMTDHAIWDSVGSQWDPELGGAVAIDLPGVGASPAAPGPHTLAGWARCVAQVVRQLPRPVCLVGHSMGGAVCMKAATELQDVLSGLILVSPTPASGMPLPPELAAGFKALHGTRAGAQQLISSMFRAPVDPQRLAPVLDGAETVSRAACHEGLDAWTGADFAAELADLRVPTRVISGADEQPLSPALLRDTVLAQIPGATLQTLPGCGHYPQLEAPAAFSALLAATVRSLAPVPPPDQP